VRASLPAPDARTARTPPASFVAWSPLGLVSASPSSLRSDPCVQSRLTALRGSVSVVRRAESLDVERVRRLLKCKGACMDERTGSARRTGTTALAPLPRGTALSSAGARAATGTAAPVVDGLLEQELDLAVHAPELVGGPPLQLVP
jgi:hypothetical protein